MPIIEPSPEDTQDPVVAPLFAFFRDMAPAVLLGRITPGPAFGAAMQPLSCLAVWTRVDLSSLSRL